MPYLKKVSAMLVVCVTVLSCSLSSCKTPEQAIETNLPNYQMVGQGNPKNTAVLFFQDPDCQANDSIASYLQKQKYYVIRITKYFRDPLELLNQDHPKVRGEEGLLIMEEVGKKYNVSTIAASGIEVHSITNWFVNTPISKAFLYPYYPTSLADHLRLSIAQSTSYLEDLHPSETPEEFYQTLESPLNPSGKLGNYSFRFYKAIWNLQPKRDLTPYRGEVIYEVLP